MDELWRIFTAAATDNRAISIICILDVLDEYYINNRKKII